MWLPNGLRPYKKDGHRRYHTNFSNQELQSRAGKTFKFFRAFSFSNDAMCWWTNRWNPRPDFDFPGDCVDANSRFAIRFLDGAVQDDFFCLLKKIKISFVIFQYFFVVFLLESEISFIWGKKLRLITAISVVETANLTIEVHRIPKWLKSLRRNLCLETLIFQYQKHQNGVC